jgi:hypothetical protein
MIFWSTLCLVLVTNSGTDRSSRPSNTPRLVLDSNLDLASLVVLLQCGLNKRCKKVYSQWQAQRKRDEEQLKKQESDQLAAQRVENESALSRIKAGTTPWLVKRALDKYP